MESKIYYHFHKKGCYDDVWFVGNTIEFDKNAFSEYSYNFTPILDAYGKKDVSILNVIDYSIKIGDIMFQLELLKMSYEAINEYSMLVRELAYEAVRFENYPTLPSRNNCVWLLRKEQIDYWRKFINGEVELYKVEVFSDVFKTRNSLISFPADSYNVIETKANKYWSYNSEEFNEDDEYLYTGKFRIIEKIEDDNLNVV